jgi:pimeloyl-ACP methyl ester carboxylesterase
VTDLELHVVDHPGPEGSPLVVFVHGTMDRSTSFARAMRLLSDVSALAYDRRGYARSRFAGPVAASVDEHVDDLLGLLNERPATVIGHSYGGDVALAAGIRRPDLVRSVGAFEPPMPWLPQWPSDTAGGAALQAAQHDRDPGAAVEAFLRRMLGDETWEMLPAKAKEDRLGEGPALVADMRSLRAEAAPFDPADVPVPVVLGWGSRSRAHQVENCRRLLTLLPDVEPFVIEGAAHTGHATHPEQFAAFVRAAITRATP